MYEDGPRFPMYVYGPFLCMNMDLGLLYMYIDLGFLRCCSTICNV